MQILFSTGSVPLLPIREVFLIGKEAGFDGCELVVGKEFNRPDYVDTVIECTQILPACSIHAPYVHIASWGDEVAALHRTVGLARVLNTELITFHPPSWLAREVGYWRWFRRISDFQQELRCDKVSLAIENMPLLRLMIPPYFLNRYRKMIRFGMERNLYFTYDITHISTYGYDIIPVFLQYLKTERLRNVHVSDYSTWSEKSHLGIGRGELPIVRLMNTMRRMGYDEKITLEMLPQELPRKTEWLQRVLTYAADYLKLHLSRC
jgi:sugar phosphate isomerase/epimerase